MPKTNKQKNFTICAPRQLRLSNQMKEGERRINVACIGGKGNAPRISVGESETKSALENSGVE